jgi:putative PIN family toxin of toxin-antitoxin system
MKNIIIDTNVFISTLLKSKNCVEILEGIKQNKFNLVISEKLIEEILLVVEKDKFEFAESEKTELKELLIEKSIPAVSKGKIPICRDPKDSIILECATAGEVDCIVTGDKDLLALKKFRNIPIITPKKFLHLLKKR